MRMITAGYLFLFLIHRAVMLCFSSELSVACQSFARAERDCWALLFLFGVSRIVKIEYYWYRIGI